MEIIIRPVSILSVLLAFTAPFALAENPDADRPDNVSASAIIHEINLARGNPASYASLLAEMRSSYSSATFRSGRAVEEAIEFLRRAAPRPALTLSPGMCRAAADHCREQSSGAMGHNGRDRSNPGARLNRYGSWNQCWAENIAYGQRSAREIVMALIIDDGGARTRPSQKYF